MELEFLLDVFDSSEKAWLWLWVVVFDFCFLLCEVFTLFLVKRKISCQKLLILPLSSISPNNFILIRFDFQLLHLVLTIPPSLNIKKQLPRSLPTFPLRPLHIFQYPLSRLFLPTLRIHRIRPIIYLQTSPFAQPICLLLPLLPSFVEVLIAGAARRVTRFFYLGRFYGVLKVEFWQVYVG